MYSYCKWQYTKGLLVILYSKEMEVFFFGCGGGGNVGGNQSETIQIVLSRLYYRTFKSLEWGKNLRMQPGTTCQGRIPERVQLL